MVDQAREGLCYQKETQHFSILNTEKSHCSDHNFILKKFVLFVLALDHIVNVF